MSNKKDRSVYYHGRPGEKYGIWNTVKKAFQFGICEDTPMLAEARLFQKIGDDARKWRFEQRPIPKDLIPVITGQNKAKTKPDNGHNKTGDKPNNNPGMYFPEFPITPYD